MAANISGALGDLTGSSGLLSAFKGHFHGNTKAMAQAVGVTPRTVQRWFTSGAEKRAPSKAARAKMAKQLPAKAKIRGQFVWDSPGGSNDSRERNIDFELDTQELAEIREALAAGNDEHARELFFEAYGMAAPDQVIGADYSFSY